MVSQPGQGPLLLGILPLIFSFS